MNRLEGDIFFAGTITPKAINLPDAAVDNAAVKSMAGIDADKLQHQHVLIYRQDDGSDVVAAIVPLWTVRGAGATVVAIDVTCLDAPSGGDKALSVDLKKCNQASPAPATILSAPVSYSNTQTDCEVEEGTVSSAALLDGDTLVLDLAVSGSTGFQGQGVQVTVTVREDAE